LQTKEKVVMERVTNDFSKVLTQVDNILQYLPLKSFNKIPDKIIEKIEENKDNEYFFEYDFEKSLLDQNIFEETKDFLSAIYLNYICEDDKKTEILKVCKQNDEKYEQELVEKYDISKLFEKRKVETKECCESENQLIVIEEKWYKKIFNIIKNLFKKNK
jgi:hypothetical protein